MKSNQNSNLKGLIVSAQLKKKKTLKNIYHSASAHAYAVFARQHSPWLYSEAKQRLANTVQTWNLQKQFLKR